MRVLVTGGAGFIGSHVVDALITKGDTVTVLDDLSSGKTDNLKTHLKNPAFQFIRGDIRDTRAVGNALADADAVIHEAAIVSVPLSVKNPELTHSVNVEGTLNLLRASSDRGIKRVVLASSCAVYGEQKKFPISEDAPSKPLSPYAASKLAAEQNCLTFRDLGGLEAVCLRYFNVYGARQIPGEYAGVMIKFLERIRADQPPIIYGDGEQTRDFVHVQDVVGATLLTLEHDGVAGEVINIGTGRGISINELCEIFLKAAGKTRIKPVHEAPRAGDIRRSQADIGKAKRLLGFRPRVPLEEGIRRLWVNMSCERSHAGSSHNV
jgi:UDP-glucose 4-epimerase